MSIQYEFPQYRKLKDKSFYKIISLEEVHEIQGLGKRWFQLHFVAHNFLDKNLILDLLETDEGRYEVISREEYELIESKLDPQ